MWDAIAERVQAVLADSVRWTGGKQRLTATRLHALLRAEGKRVGVTVVKEAVAEWKRQRREVFVPLTYRPGDLAEVDFFEVLVDVDGVRRKAWLFLMRLMHTGCDFAWIDEWQDQISFLDGHVRAFAHFEGVPARIAYDNLRSYLHGHSGVSRASSRHSGGKGRLSGERRRARTRFCPSTRVTARSASRGIRLQTHGPAGPVVGSAVSSR